MSEERRKPVSMSMAEIRTATGAIAEQMKQVGSSPLPLGLRVAFLNVRAALFQLGVYDPILVRFDSATAPPASVAELADELALVSAAL